MTSIDGVRTRLDESCGASMGEGALTLTMSRPRRADLRALLDDHARLTAEVERLRMDARDAARLLAALAVRGGVP